jgi:hypothetical protein
MQRFAAAMVLSGVVAILVPTSVEAKDKGGSGQDGVCAYLYSVMTYPYVSPTIQQAAASLFVAYGCTAP